MPDRQSPSVARRAASAGGAIEIRQVASRRDVQRFVEVPFALYADDPCWVPPLLMEVKEFINPQKHPFYLHGEAAKFLALRDGRAVGRILVSDDPNYNRQQQANLGCFGLFECVDDAQAAHALLDAAAAWLRARGRSAIMGPVDYSTNYPCGLLIDGFDTPPRLMMNHHRPYYRNLLESWGLVKVKDLYSWWFYNPRDVIAAWKQRVERIARRSSVTLRSFRMNDFEADARRCQEVYNTAHGQNWGFVHLTDAEFLYMARQISRIGDPKHILLAEIDGKTVGFAVTVPDLNEAIAPLGGRLTTFGLPIGLARLVWRLRRVATARMLVLDLLPGFRRRGIGELLILRTLEYGTQVLGYRTAELSWTLEDNHLINRGIEAVGGRPYKTYRIFEKAIC